MTVSRQPLHPDGPELSRLVWGAWRCCREPGNRHAGQARPADRRLPGAGHHQLRPCRHLWRLPRPGPLRRRLARMEGRTEPGRAGDQVRHRPGRPGAPGPPGQALRHQRRPHPPLARSVLALARHRPCRPAAAAPARPADERRRDRCVLWSSWFGPARPGPSASPTMHPAQIDLLQARLPLPAGHQPDRAIDPAHRTAARRHAGPCPAAPDGADGWSPLGGGRLFDRSTDQAARIGPVLDRVAGEHGVDAGRVALAWLLRLPGRPIPILGTTRLDRLRDLARAERIELDRQTWFELYRASLGHEVP